MKNKESRQKVKFCRYQDPGKTPYPGSYRDCHRDPGRILVVPFLLLHSREKHLTLNQCAYPEGNNREPVSWSLEEISVSRGNFLGKMQSVREAHVVRSTGSELRME